MFPLSSYKSLLLVLYFVIVPILIGVAANDIDHFDNATSIGPELEKELRLTKNEKQALDKFKLALPKKSILRTDLYKIRWLRGKLLDVDRSIRDYNEVTKVRRQQEVSNFWKYDWSDLFPKHPFAMEGFDRNGLPILTMSIGEMDMRRIVLQGKRDKFVKYLANVGMQAFDVMNEINQKRSNVTQIVFIANLDNFSPVQNACPLCIQFYIYIMELNERFLPGFVHDFIVINTPSTFEIILEMIRPVLSSRTRSAMKVFGTNKSKWKPYLDSKINPNQLPWEYGGTKVADRDD